MVRNQRRVLCWVWLFWFLPLIGIFLCFYFDVHWFVKFVVIWAFVSGLIQQLTEIVRLRQWQERIEELEREDAEQTAAPDR